MPEDNIFEFDAQNKKITADNKRIRQREIDDVKEILKTPGGRRFIWRLWSICGIFRNPFTPNSNQAGFNAGRMSVGQEILEDVNTADVLAFARIQQEYISVLHSKKEAKEAQDA